ncbi:MAG: hypothetical protein M3R38_20900 [Actinomycetota bacterium]|nr:hypothetical protein [Actinomycetota bacterium]
MDRDEKLFEFLETTNRLAFEWLKQITTLSFAAIVLISAFLRDVFDKPLWAGLIPYSLGGLSLAAVMAVLTMAVLIWSRTSDDKPSSPPGATEVLLVAGFGITTLAFVSGVGTFAVFAVRNFL